MSNPKYSEDSTIQAGGTAQTLFGGFVPPRGWAVYNPDGTNALWVSDSTTALANGAGSVIAPALGGYETPDPHYVVPGPVSIVGAVTGQKYTARWW